MIRELLNRYGVWARDNGESVTWYRRNPYLAVIPPRKTAAPSLTDDKALQVSKAIASLPAEYKDLIIDYYVLRQTMLQIGERHRRSIFWTSTHIKIAEDLFASQLESQLQSHTSPAAA